MVVNLTHGPDGEIMRQTIKVIDAPLPSDPL